MSEQTSNLAPVPEQAANGYQAAVLHGLEQAREVGFDLHQSVAANHNETLDGSAINERAEHIQTTVVTIAEDIGLEPSFFDRPANTIFMAGIADAWIQNEAKAANNPHDTKLADERAMLVDVTLMAAGRQSSFVQELADGKHAEAKRYIQEKGVDPEAEAHHAFVDGLNDEVLADKVTKLFAAEGEGSILHRQRETLGISADSQEPFEIKVLKLGDRWDLINAGVLPKPEWPTYDSTSPTEEERAARKTQLDKAQDDLDRQNELYKPFEDNQKLYDEQFVGKFGDLAPAFINRENGKVTLYLKTPDAAMLLKMAEDGMNFDEVKDMQDYVITSPVANARHEYTHTQKPLSLGEKSQLGLVLEERKAEYVSHDKQGYQDVKYFLGDLGMAHDVEFLDRLEDALKQPDALSAFMAWSATNLGLRNTLMVMASKPLPYDKNPESVDRFASLGSVTHSHDHSTHDAVIRENLAHEEGRDNYRTRAAAWAARIVANEAISTDFVRETYTHHRERAGLKLTGPYINEALDKAIADATQEADATTLSGVIR